MHPLAKQVIAGDPRAAARAISLIENHHNDRNKILHDLFPYTGKAFILGITGSPGAGKSTLVDRLITFLRGLDFKLGIIAVDPTSPFTGGAILGDRVRMQQHATDPHVFIRSMGTRGHLGGLARHTKEAIHILDAYGCEVILVETVGVGQSELEIMNVADTTAVVLSPGAGDKMQAFKAGIMEIADLYVINKADLAGADQLLAQVTSMLDIVKQGADWYPPIVKTISSENQGITQLWKAILSHKNDQQQSGQWKSRRTHQLRNEVREMVEYELTHRLDQLLLKEQFVQQLDAVAAGELDPYSLAIKLLKEIQEGGDDA